MALLPAGSVTGVWEKDVSPDQLAGIGAVALRFNLVENALEAVIQAGLRLPFDIGPELVRKIGSVESKIECAKLLVDDHERTVVVQCGQTQDGIAAAAIETLGAIGTYKRYRDAVIHCRIHNAPEGIAVKNAKGVPIAVLITKDKLDWAAKGMAELEQELNCLFGVFAQSTFVSTPTGLKLIANSKRTELAKQIVVHQKARKALGAAPKIPD